MLQPIIIAAFFVILLVVIPSLRSKKTIGETRTDLDYLPMEVVPEEYNPEFDLIH